MTFGDAGCAAGGAAWGDAACAGVDDDDLDDGAAGDEECDFAGGELWYTVVQALRVRPSAASPAIEYAAIFMVHLPVRVERDLAAGKQLIPVSVRFKACSDRECLLPRTVHLSVPIDVPAAG